MDTIARREVPSTRSASQERPGAGWGRQVTGWRRFAAGPVALFRLPQAWVLSALWILLDEWRLRRAGGGSPPAVPCGQAAGPEPAARERSVEWGRCPAPGRHGVLK